jgi:hypothetical protein
MAPDTEIHFERLAVRPEPKADPRQRKCRAALLRGAGETNKTMLEIVHYDREHNSGDLNLAARPSGRGRP